MRINRQTLESIVKAIYQADSLIIGAGAGMGVDSGLPDFRGQSGFWKAYPALAKEKLDFTQIANPQAFRHNPALAWGFYGHRLNLYRQIKPHQGFSILKKIGEQLANGYQVFTSNVDGHFSVAQFAREAIYECHGSIHYLQCSQACKDEIWPAADLIIETDDLQCLATSKLPTCHHCGAVARPNILMFDDYYWNATRSERQVKNLSANLAAYTRPVIIECGAGKAIPTVRYFCEKQKGTLIRINVRESDIADNKGFAIAEGALSALTQIDQALDQAGFYSR
ncbi:SIR2 family NAD-dependent protein deacylase [Aliikangiella maris]|uniref:protein acetyllysine N-acetyltransferase n=2 Tax=Aliikangiella maris TaxID=3162458 RepID=A0ABV2BZC6_9GAMM